MITGKLPSENNPSLREGNIHDTVDAYIEEDEKKYVVQLPLGREGVILDHHIITPGFTTTIGFSSERNLYPKYKDLYERQRCSVPYKIRRRKIVYMDVQRIVFFLDLPPLIIDVSMKIYDRIIDDLERGSKFLVSTRRLPSSLVYYACKINGTKLFAHELHECVDQSPMMIDRAIYRMHPYLKKHHPNLVIFDKHSIVSFAIHVMKSTGVNMNYNVTEWIYSMLFENASNSSISSQARSAVLSYFIMRMLGTDVILSRVASSVGFRPSTFYNSITRVFKNLGFDASMKVTEMDFEAMFKELRSRDHQR